MKIRKSELEKIVIEETIRVMTKISEGGMSDLHIEIQNAVEELMQRFDIDLESLIMVLGDMSDERAYAGLPIRNAPGAKRNADGSRSLEEGVEDMRTRNKERKKRRDQKTAKDSVDARLPHKEGVVDMDGETVITGPDGDASPEARGLARQDDLQATMLKAAMEIKNNMPQEAYETLLRALAAAGMDEKYLDDFMGYGDLEEDEAKQAEKRKKAYRGGATGKPKQGRYGY